MKETICSVFFIFLLVFVLIMGLLVSERGLQEVNGLPGYPRVLALTRAEGELWVVTFAGRRFVLNPAAFAELLK